MTHANVLDQKRTLEEHFLIRAACLIGGAIYPLWSIVYQLILEGAIDPIERRLQVSALAVFLIGLTFFKLPRKLMLTALYISLIFVTWHLMWIATLNDFHPYYQIGILVLIAATLPFYQSFSALLLYLITINVSVLALFIFFDWKKLFVFAMACCTVFIVSAYALWTRMVLIEKLRKSRQLFADSADKIESSHRDVSTMMANIHLGIFTVENPHGQIGPQHSKHLEQVFGQEITQNFNFHHFVDRFLLTADQKAQIWTIISFIGDHRFQYEINDHLLPTEVVIELADGSRRTLEIEWDAIIEESSDVFHKLLVSMRDVSELKVLRQQNEDKNMELTLLGEIISIERHRLATVFSSIGRLLEQSSREIQLEIVNPADLIAFIFREVHTIKGLARSFQLLTLANTSHQVEDQLGELRKKSWLFDRKTLQDILQPLHTIYHHYVSILQTHFGVSAETQGNIPWTSEEIDWLKQKVETTLEIKGDCSSNLREIYDFVVDKTKYPLKGILRDLVISLEPLSRELGKIPPQLQILDGGLSFSPDCHNLLQTVFTHLLRNAIDHGIERPDERLTQGKPSQGNILIKVSIENNDVHIVVRDDGQGLNLEAIRRKSEQKSLVLESASLSRQMTADMILLPDFSTKETTSKISGRGVGLDAVQAYLRGFGGQIKIELLDESMTKVAFQFRIILPQQLSVDHPKKAG